MMQKLMERSTFDKQHNYRLVLSSDNIHLRHCGNCANLTRFTSDCFIMVGYGIPPEERKVNHSRGLCNRHQYEGLIK